MVLADDWSSATIYWTATASQSREMMRDSEILYHS
jgi:hypothetical protein